MATGKICVICGDDFAEDSFTNTCYNCKKKGRIIKRVKFPKQFLKMGKK